MQLFALRPPAGTVPESALPGAAPARVPAPLSARDRGNTRRIVLRGVAEESGAAPVGALRSYLGELALGRR